MSSLLLHRNDSSLRLYRHGCGVISPMNPRCTISINVASSSSAGGHSDDACAVSSPSAIPSDVTSAGTRSNDRSQCLLGEGQNIDSLDTLLAGMGSGLKLSSKCQGQAWQKANLPFPRKRSMARRSCSESELVCKSRATNSQLVSGHDVDPSVEFTLIAALEGIRQGRPLACKDDFWDFTSLFGATSSELYKRSAGASKDANRYEPWKAAALLAKERVAATGERLKQKKKAFAAV
mmetsp:Transcript_57074/g.88809  ORF Transcript_57074/g.88809 Transcript_57074/m.88809 type:complete len:235 (+) Transcript_57074:53-757(+)